MIEEILFDKELNLENISEVELEDLTKSASANLLLPTIFYKLDKKMVGKELPKEFYNYLKYIHKINLNRNKKIINQINKISKLLRNENINHVFIKGAALLFSEIYENIGERMINDIDILIDKDQLIKAKDLFIANNYIITSDYDFFEKKNRHLRRMTSNSEICAIELHHKIINKEIDTILAKSILKRKQKNEINIPSIVDQLKINIYNSQINNYGYDYFSLDLRSAYDGFLLISKKKINLNSLKSDIYLKRYFYRFNRFDTGINIPEVHKKIRFVEKMNLISQSILGDKIFSQLIKKIIYFKESPIKLAEFINNSKYRKSLINKYFKN